jgi:hypothetical protein
MSVARSKADLLYGEDLYVRVFARDNNPESAYINNKLIFYLIEEFPYDMVRCFYQYPEGLLTSRDENDKLETEFFGFTPEQLEAARKEHITTELALAVRNGYTDMAWLTDYYNSQTLNDYRPVWGVEMLEHSITVNRGCFSIKNERIALDTSYVQLNEAYVFKLLDEFLAKVQSGKYRVRDKFTPHFSLRYSKDVILAYGELKEKAAQNGWKLHCIGAINT